jgi:hypothetical protein
LGQILPIKDTRIFFLAEWQVNPSTNTSIAKLDFPLSDELKAGQYNWQGATPFPGLVAFEAKDAQVFFGRNTQISTLFRTTIQTSQCQAYFLLNIRPQRHRHRHRHRQIIISECRFVASVNQQKWV